MARSEDGFKPRRRKKRSPGATEGSRNLSRKKKGAAKKKSSGGMSTAAIGGIAGGSFLLGGLVFGMLVFVMTKPDSPNTPTDTGNQQASLDQQDQSPTDKNENQPPADDDNQEQPMDTEQPPVTETPKKPAKPKPKGKPPLSRKDIDVDKLFARSKSSGISKNHLKQIGLSLHNYHDVHRIFPPGGVYDKATKKNRHSWMTMILPFMDQAPLYHKIDFHTAWDVPKHKKIFTQSISEYLNPHFDTTQVNQYSAAHYSGNSHVFFRNSDTRMRSFTDGMSNTILGGEISKGFMAWGDPENIRDPANGLKGGAKGFGSPFQKVYEEGVNMLMGDGRVRHISKDIDPKTLKAISTPHGGEDVKEY